MLYRSLTDRLWLGAGLALLVGACTAGASGEPNNRGPEAFEDDEIGSGAPLPAEAVDPGFVGIHRLNNTEYENTVKDLLGVSGTPAASFPPDEQALGFDNIASALGMTPAQYEQYFHTARALANEVFQDSDLRARVVVCSDDNDECTQQIVRSFSSRAWRRPPEEDEMARLVQLVDEARAAGEDRNGAFRHVVATVLAAPNFLYRIEKDADGPRRLDDYELASRLSYLLWSTMPDDELFELAAARKLNAGAELERQVQRMLNDERGRRYVDAFAGQWLGIRSLRAHQVDVALFPEWNEALRDAMAQEASLYFQHFLSGEGASARDFFTLPLNFVNDRLATHYGASSGKYGDRFEAVHDAFPQRRGFLGLASYLTERSFVHRTSPTARGVWVISNLLCEELPAPPAVVPELDETPVSQASSSDNVRERLAAHRENPGCASCHAVFDPVGLGLENFDAIGRYRETYASGDPIDASGELPDGETFNGLGELSEILAQDARFSACMVRKLFTHALGRDILDTDEAALKQLQGRWHAEDLNVRALLRHMVLSESFRSRRPEL